MIVTDGKKHAKRLAKVMAKAEWRRFLPAAETHIQAMMMDPEASETLKGKVKFKIRNHAESGA